MKLKNIPADITTKSIKEAQTEIKEIIAKLEDKNAEIADKRKLMVSTGDRSAKIRTYNYPQNRITDHRIGFTTHRLAEMLNGDLAEMSETLTTHFRAEMLKDSEAAPDV